MNKKLNSNDIAETGRYFAPNAQLVTALPDIKSVRDFSEVWMKNKTGTFDNYKMVKGNWLKTGSNVNNITNIASGGSGGSGTAGVDSFNGRTGSVNPQAGDYNAAMVGLGNVTNDAQLKISQLDTDGTLSADSDTRVASQKATKTYVDNKIWNIDGGSASSIYLASQILDGGGA